METIRKHAQGQLQTLGIIALALVAVLAYSFWGSYVLHQQQLAAATGVAVADTR
jgi:hypothetical protein